ncbi:MAG: hypothetical protein GY756_20800 [bacterium]|nr:hypothetical protein [bacterium]
MKQKFMKHSLSIPLVLLLLVGFLNSCKKSSDNPALVESKVEFVFSSSQIKSVSEQGLANIVISVEDAQGNSILNSEKIDIYHMNGKYISEPVEMLVGDYKLTRFLVLNGENDVVYATPKEGSDNAHLVEKPLPINFSASEDSKIEVTPEVILVANSNPEEFGYVSFSFDIANSFKILMGAAVLESSTQSYKLTDAQVKIYSATTLVYEGNLDPYSSGNDSPNYDPNSSVDEISLPEEFTEYTVMVSKLGYKDYSKTFQKEELRLYHKKEDKGPLIVTLDKNGELPLGSANFTASPEYQQWPANTITIENLSITDADEYIFDFGDNTKDVKTSFVSSLSHSYDSHGVYSIKLTIVKDGCTSEHIVVVTITPEIVNDIVVDVEGNEYKTVMIGNQTWMAENLKVTKFNDGTDIENVTDHLSWHSLTTPAYCWYDNSEVNKEIYGGLYNWHTVDPEQTPKKNICPVGWHAPSMDEWTELIVYLGGPSIAGKHLKEVGSAHWNSQNIATNESGFTALPGGIGGEPFEAKGINGLWWSQDDGKYIRITTQMDNVFGAEDPMKTMGLSVRCIED